VPKGRASAPVVAQQETWHSGDAITPGDPVTLATLVLTVDEGW